MSAENATSDIFSEENEEASRVDYVVAGLRAVAALECVLDAMLDERGRLDAPRDETSVAKAHAAAERVRVARSKIEGCAVRGERVIAHYNCGRAGDGCKGKRQTAAVGCGKRICPVCCWRHADRNKKKANAMLDAFRTERPLMVTLTIKSGFDLAERAQVLLQSFTRLTRRKWWRDRVPNYVACVEVTWSPLHGWHPHLHIAIDTNYLPWSQRQAYSAIHGNVSDKEWNSWFFGKYINRAERCKEKLKQVKRRLRVERSAADVRELGNLSKCCAAHASGLVEEWNRATRGESEAAAQWITKDRGRVADELCKYIAKFIRWTDRKNEFPIERLAEFFRFAKDAHFFRASQINYKSEIEPGFPPCESCGCTEWKFYEAECVMLDSTDASP